MAFRINLILFSISLFSMNFIQAQATKSIRSPDGQIEVRFELNATGAPVYSIFYKSQPALRESRLGLIRDDEDFSRGLTMAGESKVESVEDRYEILTAKRRFNTYLANRKIFHLTTDSGQKMNIIFQVSRDGVAFRYYFPETSTTIHRLKEEVTSFHLQPDAKAWLEPMQVAKTGYESSNPAYEEFYAQGISVGTPSTLGAGWVYPALFNSDEQWILISEGSLGRNDCATRLRHESPDGEYSIGLPDSRETIHDQPAASFSTLPWLTPWRLIVIGSLKTIAESTLGIDLAEKPTFPADASIKPGKASWSWPLLGDNQTTYDVQKRFIDYAADMGWTYCLIDAWWDKQIGYDRVKELADYARGKNVGLLLWYNSAGDWNTIKQTPKDKLLTHQSRVQEFDRLKAMGIKGLKIDFFGGDGQPNIAYYHDLLEDAAPYGFLMNFHGTTLPRGWQRTYPHLMTAEAIRGFEYITFNQKDADQEATHAAMLPFTRNVFDPMDFTPVCLDKINRKVQRKTTSAFELALSVLFTSGIQHYVEIPDGMAKMPDYVKEFMKYVPSIWDDTKFIDGYPGKFVVLARKGGGRWYVAGINSEESEKPLILDLSSLPLSEGFLITDGKDQLFDRQPVKLSAGPKVKVTLKPHGGFVMTLNQQP
jgi:alpha-glucosidase